MARWENAGTETRDETVGPSLYRNLPYTPVRDLAPITLAVVTSLLLVAHPSFAPGTLQEFIEHAKHNPRTVNIAIAGPGTGGHIATELFKRMAGVDVVTVPYKAGNLVMAGILSGQSETARMKKIIEFAGVRQE